ncbi:MAG: hypothetical protein IPJ31_14505 [Bacteroidetes bacterium]|nr:hypothetical protein [Bacteroidota bacterium]
MNYRAERKGILQHLGIKHHEYWPWWLLVIPIWPLWIFYMFRTGKVTWFTAVNPGMEDSGFLGESKIKILDSIPDKYKPKTIFIAYQKPITEHFIDIPFPLIAKPDIGGRGRKIRILKNAEELHQYHAEVGENYMLQEVIPYELELGVFYIRMPYESKGKIVSLSEKEFLKVVGDGSQTIRQLMLLDYRSSLQIERLEKGIDMEEVLPQGVAKLLEPIGNHCRGTIFRDRGDLITDALCEVFDTISKSIEGFYYGRYDLRVRSMDDLLKGDHIQIMELNGITADAAHIFDPNARLRDALGIQISNCIQSFKIARYNIRKGAKTTPVLELYRKSVNGF